MKRVLIPLLVMCLLVLTIGSLAAAGDTATVKIFLITGESNAGSNGNGELLPAAMKQPVANAWLYSPQTFGNKQLRVVEPFRYVKTKFGITRTGYGLELPIAYALRQSCPDMKMIFVRQYSGGTSLIGWSPDYGTAQWKADMAGVGHASKPPVYPKLLNVMNGARTAMAAVPALSGQPTEVAGAFYVVTERDSKYNYGATRYEAYLRRIIAGMRASWAAPNMDVVFVDSHTSLAGYAATVRQAATNVAAVQPSGFNDAGGAVAVPGTGLVAVRDLPKYKDNVHFNSEGLNELGRRFAEQWLALNGGCN